MFLYYNISENPKTPCRERKDRQAPAATPIDVKLEPLVKRILSNFLVLGELKP
jgi:hypothetical protein